MLMIDTRGNHYLILGEPGVGATPGFVLAQLLETGETIQLNANYIRKPNNTK